MVNPTIDRVSASSNDQVASRSDAEPTQIYLDYAASTPIDPRVALAMSAVLTSTACGNPAALTHSYGKAAARLVESAREDLALLVNAQSDEIVWTSGATESNNLALKGAAQFYAHRGQRVAVSVIEHESVLASAERLEKAGYELALIGVHRNGRLDLDRLRQALSRPTILVSVMHVNNEVGVIQDIEVIAGIVHAAGALLHVDAAQSLGKIPIDLAANAVDLMSFSAHKIHGPQGVGGLFVRRRPRVRLSRLLDGGLQEQGLRAGTVATHQVVGFGVACRLARAEMEADRSHAENLRDRLLAGLKPFSGVEWNSDPVVCSPWIVNLSLPGFAGDNLLGELPSLALASGSACHATRLSPSHVLEAMGRDWLGATHALRISFGRFTTEAHIDSAICAIGDLVR